MADFITVWCLVIGAEQKALGDAFPMHVPDHTRVIDLKDKVKKKPPYNLVLEHVHRANISVYRFTNPKLLVDVSWAQLEEGMSNVNLMDMAEDLAVGRELKTYGLSDGEVLLFLTPISSPKKRKYNDDTDQVP